MNHLLRFPQLLTVIAVCAQIFVIEVIPGFALTYYVTTTGSDSNSGVTISSPFRTIQRCIDAMVAGDTCTVGDGTYTVPDSVGVVAYLRTSNANGTAGNPITLRSTNPGGAKIVLPSRNNGNHGFYVSRSYWIIEGFDISGGGSNGTSAAHHGFAIDGSTGVVIRNNVLHHIANNVCSNAVYGNTGIYLSSTASNTVIDGNRFYDIGRLRNGENGCSTVINGNDHGIYVEAVPGLTIQRNVFYRVNRGWPIHVYKSGGGTTSNLRIYSNTFANQAPAGTNPPPGHILLQSTLIDAKVINNVSHDGYLGMVHCALVNPTNVIVDRNLSDRAIKTTTCPPGVAFLDNMADTNPSFSNASSNDYRLSSGSKAIDAGMTVGLPYNGTAPDMGAFEFGQTGNISPPKNLRVQ
jgi:hypothetical protein